MFPNTELCIANTVSGIALIIVGSVIETQYRSYLDFFSSSYLSIPVLLITLGVVIFVVGFFGCCGAMKESHCMVVTFAAFLIIIFILELCVGIGAYLMRDSVSDYMKISMIKSMKNYNITSYSGVSKTWDVLQHEHHCCGTNGYTDWKDNEYGSSINGVPRDCCKHSVEECGNNIFSGGDLSTIYQDGCFAPLRDFMKENVTVLGGVAIGIGFVQLIGVVFSCCLARSIKRQYETV
ncbi:CD63 antigen-like isoform X2 [Oratosquilla oratoria]|uniref:CD63 antigen-like isoform X2 n=1 Tax=Oratosquilla oratoria TaxID=337810 RepID=UPI003F773D0E